jgi:hypothetical protein
MRKEIAELQRKHKLLWDTMIKKVQQIPTIKFDDFSTFKKIVFIEIYGKNMTRFFCFGCFFRSYNENCLNCLFDIKNLDAGHCLDDYYDYCRELYDNWVFEHRNYAKLIFTMKKIRDWPLNKRFK